MLIQNSSNIQVAPSTGPARNGAASAASGIVSSFQAAPAQAAPEPSPAQLQSAITSLNDVMQSSNVSLTFSLDSGTDTPVVNVTDTTTGKLITQFPSKATLAIAQAIDASQKRQGLLFNERA